MPERFVVIWFRHLTTDWLSRHQPSLKNSPFVVAHPDHGRLVITAANAAAQGLGIDTGMAVADARVLFPGLTVMDHDPELADKLLTAIGEWCIRYTPIAATDSEGLLLDVSGCPHLWGDEERYLKEILTRFRSAGYDVRGALAGTIGTAWALSHFGQPLSIIESGLETNALLPLPPAALRLEPSILERLHKLGLTRIAHFINMPRSVLRRRFGQSLLQRLDQALGREDETILPLHPIEPYQERLPCVEPIVTPAGIEIALRRLLETVCIRLRKEGKGIRIALFKGYRVDGKIEQIGIGTNRPSCNTDHLFKLFELKIPTLEPELGIELFVLEAPKVEETNPFQESLWGATGSLEAIKIAELLDRMAGKLGAHTIHRYLPDEHHWPERSLKNATGLEEKPAIPWPDERRRPIQLLKKPEPIQVMAPIPDYPPMQFKYKSTLFKIKKAEGPERIEQEWWIQSGLQRDYYTVEDEEGRRYWIFRSGHYTGEPNTADTKSPAWFLHGFFA